MVVKPPVFLIGETTLPRRAAAGDILIDLSHRVDHAMKVSIAPRHLVEQRVGCDASPLNLFAKLLAEVEQCIDVVEREGEPLSKVASIVPAACSRPRGTIRV